MPFNEWGQPREQSDLEKLALEKRKRELEQISIGSKRQDQRAPVVNKTGVQELRESLVELVMRNAGVRINISLDREQLPDNAIGTGFQSLESRLMDGREPAKALGSLGSYFLSQEDRAKYHSADSSIKDKGIRELISISSDEKYVTEEVLIPGNNGFLGFGATPARKETHRTNNKRPVLHNEIVEGGSSEPAIRITYYIPQGDWDTSTGRPGQSLLAEIVLPASVATEIVSGLYKDPGIIRLIVERFMETRLLKTPELWKAKHVGDSLRPPYERWDSEPNGGRIYIQVEGGEFGFNPKNLHEVIK